MQARQFEQFLDRLSSLTRRQRERLLALLQSAAGLDRALEVIDEPGQLPPPLVWIASARLPNTRIGAWAAANNKHSFFVFLAHMPLLRVFQLSKAKFFPHMQPLAMAIGATAIVAVLLCMADEVAMALMPNAFNVMIGARALRPGTALQPTPIHAPAFVERRRAPRPANAPVYTDALRRGLLAAKDEADMAQA